ncbi:DNA-processing protein DprA [Microbacterium paludicola]|uniref:DNA-processing protein DprA n=1 Tax=Microbacterium paludicola TaxID=300019 RepID=UPI0031DC57E3
MASPLGDPELLTARLAWSALAEPGDSVSGRLVAECGPVAALRLVEDLAAGVPTPEIPGVTPQELTTSLRRWQPRLDARMFESLAVAAVKAGLAVLTPEGPLWPERFEDLGEHAPLALWVRGEPAALGGLDRSAALVGARAATPYGEHVAATLAGELAEQGVGIVSGGAYGVDGAAHRAALGVKGTTVAFVAGGADRVYPAAHAHLFARIADGGAVVAEVPPGGTPTKWRFLMRNRLIAAVSAATVVVEAGWRSGSLNTAGHAAALGRPLGAVPGPVTSATSEGCHRLLREFDATCITRASDVLELIGEWGVGDDRTGGDRPRPEAIRVLDALAVRAWRTLDDIARRSGMSLAEVQAELGLLELDGRIESSLDGWRLHR